MKHPIAHLSLALVLGALALEGTALAGQSTTAPAPGNSAPAQAGAEEEKPLYYARVPGDDLAVRNLADPKGIPVAKPKKGSVVAVFAEEPAGWLQVEVPGGYDAYVYGRYLEATGSGDVYRVTRNAVNIRPMPSSNVQSFPLPQRLHAGDLVRVTGLQDPDAGLAETWVRIWTPPGVRAFVKAGAVEKLSDEEGLAAWGRAVSLVSEQRAASGGPVPADAPKPAANGDAASADAGTADTPEAAEARAQLLSLRAELEAERLKGTPDYERFRAAYRALVEGKGDERTKAEAARDLERVDAYAKAAALKAELERLKAEKDQTAARTQKEIWEAGRHFDPLQNAFDYHGVLVRRIDPDGTPHYLIEVRREVVAELLCTTGRYDLDAFSGYEIGVRGHSVVAEAAASKDGSPVLDVARIQVLKRR